MHRVEETRVRISLYALLTVHCLTSVRENVVSQPLKKNV